jgi:hypothetical protein
LTEEKAEAFLANIKTRVLAFLTRRYDLERLSERREILDGLLARLRELTAPAHLPPHEVAEDQGKNASTAVGIAVDRRTGCWICGQGLEAVFRFLSKHQYQLTIDRAAQQEHAKRGGFCSLHTWQYENISSPYGVCASYPALVHRLASELQALAGDVDGPIRTFENISNLGASQGTCQVCQVRIEAERNAVHEAADRIRKITNSQVGNMPACCLVHLAMTTSVLGKGQPARLLLGAHAQFLERLGEDAQRYALRHDALRRYLTSEEERRASQLLLLMLAGHRNVSAPWQVEFFL